MEGALAPAPEVDETPVPAVRTEPPLPPVAETWVPKELVPPSLPVPPDTPVPPAPIVTVSVEPRDATAMMDSP
jgi:hypothetical protein